VAERLANLGYLALVKEVTIGTPLVPTDFVPYYKESISTMWNLVDDNPIAGVKFARLQVLPGTRDHKGDFEVMAEPNTAARFFDMLLTQGTGSGAGPYTYPFTLSAATNPKSYTVDISSGNQVFRFWGVQASKISPSWDKSEMHLNVSVSALGSFMGRGIATVATTTLTLDTLYDPAPNKGLVVGDLVRIYKSSTGATLDTTIATVNVDGITVTLGASAAAFAAGDTISLRPQTPTYNNLTPFLWPKTQFCFGATAAAALSATQVRLETGSNWEVHHKFESDTGADRSGSFDPAALIRTQGDAVFKIKKFFDTTEDVQQFLAINKSACVIRHFSGANNQYELRVTLNDLRVKQGVDPKGDTGKILYSEIEFSPVQSASDGQALDVKLINNLSTV
jgi:hypothetical protein